MTLDRGHTLTASFVQINLSFITDVAVFRGVQVLLLSSLLEDSDLGKVQVLILSALPEDADFGVFFI